MLSLWCWWSQCILLLAPGAKLRKSHSWHVEANALHRRVVAKLHGKHSLARSLKIRLIVTQKPQEGRKKSSVMPLYIAVHLDCTTGKLAWNRNARQHAQKYFHCVRGSLVMGCSMEFSTVMNVRVQVTTGAIEQDGEKGYDWHKQILIKIPTISLLFTHNVDCISAVLTGTNHGKISTAVSDSST